METETNMETETETDNSRKWTWPRKWTWTWNRRTFAKYFIRRNCPNSAMWNASEISRRNFQWHYRLVAPLHNRNDYMKFLKSHTPFGIAF
jgi:hypothetical protein